jgi:hypothetical protein
MKKFQLKQPKQKFSAASGYGITLNTLSIDDCAKQCLDLSGTGMDCKYFDYCYINGECQLKIKNLDIDSNATLYESNKYCDIYQRDVLFHYTEFPGKSVINKKVDILYKNIQTNRDCANLCDNEIEVHCRSFNYCPSTKECYLSTNHMIDSVDNTKIPLNLVCTHYSRDYLQDFTFISIEKVALESANFLIEGVSREECSRSCVGADGFLCETFDYCTFTNRCLLKNGAGIVVNNDMSAADLTFDSCENYKRDFFYITSLIENSNRINDTSTSKKIVF